MKEPAKVFIKIMIWPIGFLLLLSLYFADNIKGYYRFKELCAKEAGLKVYQPLERDVGWFSDKNESGYLLYSYPGIAFVRYADKAQSLQDLIRTTEKKDSSDDGFRPEPADAVKQPLYGFRKTIEEVPNESRMTRFKTTVTNLKSGQTVVVYQDFLYRIFSPDWGVAQGTACSSLNHLDSDQRPSRVQQKAIQQAFLNK